MKDEARTDEQLDRKFRILIAEDEMIIATDLERILTGVGYYSAGIFMSGEEVLQEIDEARPDLVLMDIRLRGELDGLETAARIRERYRIPVVYLTGYAEETVLQEAKLTDPFGYVGKPVRERELRATIEMALYRHQMERKLRESEEKYRALYDNAPLSYQSLDRDGCILDVNPSWLRTLGYEREDVIGRCFAEFLHPDWKPHFEKRFSEFKRRGYEHDVPFKVRHKDGHYLHISFEGRIGHWPDGSFHQTYCVFQDITERKRAEEELKVKDHAIASSISAIALADLAGNLSHVNDAWLRMYGIDDSAQVIGKSAVGFFSSERDALSALGILRDIGSWEGELRAERSDGTPFDVHLATGIVLDEAGEPIYIMTSGIDITERKRAEEALRESEELFRSAFEDSAIGMMLGHQDGRYIKVNRALSKILGYSQQELLSMGTGDTTYPGDIDQRSDLARQLWTG